MVSSSTGLNSGKTNPLTIKEGPVVEPGRGNSPTLGQDAGSQASGLETLKQQLREEKISEGAGNLIANCRRGSTTLNYNCAWSQFTSWCQRRGFDPVRCPIEAVLDYLYGMFDRKLAVNYIKVHRSAISAFHEKVDGLPLGKHHRVSQLLKGAGNLRTPKPKAIPVWDVSSVLNFMDSCQNEGLDLKGISLKLITLLAITSLHRGLNCTYLV